MEKSDQPMSVNWKAISPLPIATAAFYLANYLLAKYYYSLVGVDFALLSDSSTPLTFAFERPLLVIAEGSALIAIALVSMANNWFIAFKREK